MIPAMYLGREGVRLETHGDRTQYLVQAIQYFTSLGNALNTLYNAVYVGFTELAGMTSRVVELIGELERRGGTNGGNDVVANDFVQEYRKRLRNSNRLSEPTRFDSENIMFKRVTIFSPEGRLLVKDLDLMIRRGENLIVEGPNGAGKTVCSEPSAICGHCCLVPCMLREMKLSLFLRNRTCSRKLDRANCVP